MPKPLFQIKKFRGINDRVASRDKPETALDECKNWEIDDVLGDLVLGKGYAKRFTDDLGGDAKGLIEYKVIRDNNAKILICQKDANTMSYYRNSENKVDLNAVLLGSPISVTSELKQVYFNESNGNCYGGTGDGVDNIPFWLGYIKRKTFWSGTAFAFPLNSYYYKLEECLPPSIGSDPAGGKQVIFEDITDRVGATLTGDFRPEAGTAYYDFTATLIYDGFQESPLPSDDDGAVNSNYIVSVGISVGAVLARPNITFNIYVDRGGVSGVSIRTTGINIYMRRRGNNPVIKSGWKLVRTIYWDETRISERPYDEDGTLNSATYPVWEQHVGNVYKYKPSQDSSNPYRTYISASEWDNALERLDILTYPTTNRTMPNYKYSTVLKGTRYVAGALYPRITFDSNDILSREYNLDDYLPDVVYFSPPDRPNILPITNYIKFTENITGLGKTNSSLLIFGENSLAIYDEGRQYLDDYAKDGCVSHRSIAEHNGVVYWAGKFGVNMFDRFYPKDISSLNIRKVYKNIPLDNLRNSEACMDLANREYVLTIPDSSLILKYNIDTGEWTKKTAQLTSIAEGVDQDVIAIDSGDSKYIMTYNSGYSHNGTYYIAEATTKVLDGESATNIIKSLTLGYCSYSTDDSLSIEIIVDSVVVNTITLSANATLKPKQFSIGGSYGLANENYQLRIKLTTSASTTKGRIGFIKLFGDVHDIQGG